MPGAARPPDGRGVGHGDDAHRTARGTRVVAHRPHPRHVAAGSHRRCPRARRAPLPSRRRRRPDPEPVRATTTASTPPASRAACRQLLGGSDEVGRGCTRADPDDLDAPRRQRVLHHADSHVGSSVTTRHDRVPASSAPPSSEALSSNTAFEPAVAGAVGLLRGLGRHERGGDDDIEHMAEVGDAAGPHHFELPAAGRSVRTSEPFEKMMFPELHANGVARRGTRRPDRAASGDGIAAMASERPPVWLWSPALLAGACWRRPEVTMRVAAIGDSAFTVTPGGGVFPSCQVSAATARFAQLYAPAFAGRHPEPEVTPEDAAASRRAHDRQRRPRAR